MSQDPSFIENTVSTVRRFRVVAGIAATTIGIGSVAYHFIEGWNWLDSVYFSTITLTTIGYGDYTPTTNLGKLFTIFYVLIGVAIIAATLNILLKGAAARRIDKHRSRREISEDLNGSSH